MRIQCLLVLIIGINITNAIVGPWRRLGSSIKNGSVQLICPSDDLSRGLVLFKVDSENVDLSIVRKLTTCYPNFCATVESADGRYKYYADSNNIYVNISQLTRSTDQMWWIAAISDSLKAAYKLEVISVPTMLQYYQVPAAVDLALSDVVLGCETDCAYPQPDIRWFYSLDGKSTQVWKHMGTQSDTAGTCADFERKYRSILTLSRFTTLPSNSDTIARFQCGITSFPELNGTLFSVLSDTVWFAVPAGPPTLRNQTAGALILLSGDIITMECLSSATRPPVTVIWKVGNVKMNTVTDITISVPGGLYRVKSVITIVVDKSYNGQNLTCETFIDGQGSHTQASQSIDVYWPPSNNSIAAVDNFPWLERETNRYLESIASDYGNPVASVTWNTTVGQPLMENPRRLQMPILDSIHNGVNIICHLHNEYTERKHVIISKQITLNVEFPPILMITVDAIEMTNITLVEGQNLQAACSATGNPVPTFVWEGSRSGQLLFSDINRKSDGLYVCRAEAQSTRYGLLASQINLNVVIFYPPVIGVTVPETLLEQNSFTIQCKALGKPANSSLVNLTQTWMGVFIKVHAVPDNGEVFIYNPTIQDSGNYTCYGQNGIPDRSGTVVQSGTAEALIRGKPIVPQRTHGIYAGKIGETINITIPLYSFPDVTSVTVRQQNGTDIQTDDRYAVTLTRGTISMWFYNTEVELNGYLLTMQISNLQKSDFSNYTLVLQNSVGVTTWKFQQISQSRPQSPKTFILVDLEDDVPVFLMEGGFNGGLLQRFIVETAINGTDEWKERIRFDENDVHYKLRNGSFRFNISGLIPQRYQVRVLAENSLGRIEEHHGVVIYFTIENKGTEYIPERRMIPAVAVGGGIGSALLAIAVAVIALVIWKRRSHVCYESSKELTESNTREYLDLQRPAQYGNLLQEYEGINAQEGGIDSCRSQDIYTKLGQPEEHLYDRSNSGCTESNRPKQADDAKVYVNLQIT